jgi:hypothetical protein
MMIVARPLTAINASALSDWQQNLMSHSTLYGFLGEIYFWMFCPVLSAF